MTPVTQWPSNRFFWALIDPRPLPRRLQRSHEQHRLLLEPHLPVPLADVHAAFARCADGQLVACAIEHRTLHNEVTPAMRRLIPEAVPEALGADLAETHALNLLTGEYEPHASRRAGQLLFGSAIVALLSLATIVSAGHLRRAQAAEDRTHRAYSETASILSEVLDRAIADDPRAVSLAHREVHNQLSALRQSRDGSTVDAELHPADHSLATFLAAWPRDPEIIAQVRTLAVSPMRIRCDADVATSDTPSKLREALDQAAGWTAKIDSYRDQSTGSGSRSPRRGSTSAPLPGVTSIELTRRTAEDSP